MDQIVQLVNRGDEILRMTDIDAAAPRRSTPCARRAASIALGVFFLRGSVNSYDGVPAPFYSERASSNRLFRAPNWLLDSSLISAHPGFITSGSHWRWWLRYRLPPAHESSAPAGINLTGRIELAKALRMTRESFLMAYAQPATGALYRRQL
jgi:hypothetical protein